MTQDDFHLPKVSCVIATCGRPELLRKAILAAANQSYVGELEIVVVFDRIPRKDLEDIRSAVDRAGRTLHSVANQRTPGLAGARNTGILTATGELIAFCDDDDAWAGTKIALQVKDWSRFPDAVAHATGISIETGGGVTVRRAPSETTFADFLRSRVTAIHPSSIMFRRRDLTGRIGLVDEDLPEAYGEDYELLLRAARFGPVRALPEPLTIVGWSGSSEFSGKWEKIAAGLTYILRKYPEFADSPHGTARIAGQVAFAHAAMGRRSEAWVWARSALSRDKVQPRAYASLMIASGLVSATRLLKAVQAVGHGL
ncbi:glycosyltransferase family 2 protein [Arthrobacter sp. MDB2-24]